MIGQAMLCRTPSAGARSDQAPRSKRSWGGRLKRWGQTGLGAFLIVAGVVIAPLPGPFGLPVSVLGVGLVLRSSIRAKRTFVRLQGRYPNWIYPIRRLLRPRPPFASVGWRFALKVERFVSRGRLTVLEGLRRRLKARRGA